MRKLNFRMVKIKTQKKTMLKLQINSGKLNFDMDEIAVGERRKRRMTKSHELPLNLMIH